MVAVPGTWRWRRYARMSFGKDVMASMNSDASAVEAAARKSRIGQFVDYGVYLVVRIFVCVIQACSLETCHTIASFLAWLFADVLRVRHRTLDGNLRKAFPEKSEAERRKLARSMWRHLLVMLCEIAHAPRRIHRSNWRKYVRLRQMQPLAHALLTERPVVTVTGHFGNFEMAGYLSGLFGYPTYTIARPLDNPHLDRFVNQFRGATGQFMLPKEGSAPAVQRVMEAGETIALLADQHAGPSGCWVEMFGQPTSCHKAVALFALSSGAPLLISYARRTGKPMHFELGMADHYDPELDVQRSHNVTTLTQWYCDHLERLIRESPEQYWWVHRVWRGAPPKRGRRKRAA